MLCATCRGGFARARASLRSRPVSSTSPSIPRPRAPARRSSQVTAFDRFGDRMLRGLCALGGVIAVAVLADIVYQVISGARPAISRFGLGFVGHAVWAPNFSHFGAATMLYGTAVSSLMGLVIAAPLGIAIAIYLAMLAPRSVRTIVGPLVEMLAAIPSVVLGFWGVVVLAPFVHTHSEPWLHSTLRFLPIFGSPQTTGLSIFTAGLILTVMMLPIIASLSRDLFLTVPSELREGAEALGATRWEVIRGVVLPTTSSGVAAATVLGLGRALGEAIAVTQVVGDGSTIHASLFLPGTTLASKIANDFQNTVSNLHVASLFYLALILLAIGIATSLIAQAISHRFDVSASLPR
jgi:phosphate transport system permease protein